MNKEEAIHVLKEMSATLKSWRGMNNKDLTPAENGCCGCRHEHKEPADEPCKRCRNNYLNLWEPMPKVREFTEDDLIGIFRDAFVERRAIGILDIENKVKELFE